MDKGDWFLLVFVVLILSGVGFLVHTAIARNAEIAARCDGDHIVVNKGKRVLCVDDNGYLYLPPKE